MTAFAASAPHVSMSARTTMPAIHQIRRRSHGTHLRLGDGLIRLPPELCRAAFLSFPSGYRPHLAPSGSVDEDRVAADQVLEDRPALDDDGRPSVGDGRHGLSKTEWSRLAEAEPRSSDSANCPACPSSLRTRTRPRHLPSSSETRACRSWRSGPRRREAGPATPWLPIPPRSDRTSPCLG